MNRLRTQIINRRNQYKEDPVSYKISFFPNKPLHGSTKTQPNQVFTVELNPNDIYPANMKSTGGASSFSIKDQNGTVINFPDTYYTDEFNVSNALGILVAEQLRFSTLDLE